MTTKVKTATNQRGIGKFLRDALGGEDAPVCDAVEQLSFRPTAKQARTGKASDPFNCTAARCAQACLNYPVVVLKTVAYINMPVDQATAKWNRRHNGLRLKAGENAWHRFRHDKNLQGAIRALDAGGKFNADFYSFLPASVGGRLTRDKASATRRKRADHRLTGEKPARSVHPVDHRRVDRLRKSSPA